jgi:hypothetical protein
MFISLPFLGFGGDFIFAHPHVVFGSEIRPFNKLGEDACDLSFCVQVLESVTFSSLEYALVTWWIDVGPNANVVVRCGGC